MNFKVPAINQSFYDKTVAKQIEEKILYKIRPNFGYTINYIASITGVDKNLIESFIFIESGGNPNAKTPYAYGLMQVGLATASDALVFEKGSGRLRPQEEALVKKYLGDRWKYLEKVKDGQRTIGKTFITKQD